MGAGVAQTDGGPLRLTASNLSEGIDPTAAFACRKRDKLQKDPARLLFIIKPYTLKSVTYR